VYKHRKDESNLIAKWKLKAGKKHYFHVFLWADQQSFDENTLGNKPGQSRGCVNLAPSIISFKNEVEREIIRPKLGEVHFIKDKWDLEVVAHELCHALIQRIRMINPSAKQIVNQDEDNEEDICYEFGAWVDEIYHLLWSENPNMNWTKNK